MVDVQKGYLAVLFAQDHDERVHELVRLRQELSARAA